MDDPDPHRDEPPQGRVRIAGAAARHGLPAVRRVARGLPVQDAALRRRADVHERALGEVAGRPGRRGRLLVRLRARQPVQHAQPPAHGEQPPLLAGRAGDRGEVPAGLDRTPGTARHARGAPRPAGHPVRVGGVQPAVPGALGRRAVRDRADRPADDGVAAVDEGRVRVRGVGSLGARVLPVRRRGRSPGAARHGGRVRAGRARGRHPRAGRRPRRPTRRTRRAPSPPCDEADAEALRQAEADGEA